MNQRWMRFAVPIVVFLMIAAACSKKEDEGSTGGSAGPTQENTGKVNILAAVEPEEAAAIQEIADDQVNPNVDYDAEFEASGNFEQDVQVRGQAGTLDLIMLPQVGTIPTLVTSAHAVSLEDMGFDIAELEDTFGKPFMDLGLINGKHYAIPTNINLKSMIWYPKDDFDAAGYKVPKTWDELMALSDQIVADGGTPWCVGFQSEGSTGWPATDWMEDIMLRTAGPEKYDQWWKHEIPFNDPSVENAGKIFGDVMFHPNYVLGGAENTPGLAFGDAPLPMFDDPPGCWLHRQASFINAFFPKDAKAGVDYDWFPFPSMDTEGGPLFGGEMMMVFRNSPEVKDFVERFMGTDFQCAMGGITAASRLSPNVNVDTSCYANEILADSAEVLKKGLESGSARFDASDLMPPAVGSGSFWTGMVQYMKGGPDSLDGILEDIENSWQSS
jgi:alpha-glucoside transport system substrate-binding protein